MLSFYKAMFRYGGKQVSRRVGPAWLERDGAGGFRKRKGKVQPGFYDERTVHVRAAQIAEKYVSGEEERERAEREKQRNGPTFREVAESHMRWVEHVKDATLQRCARTARSWQSPARSAPAGVAVRESRRAGS